MGRLTTKTEVKTELKLHPKLERQLKTEIHGYAAIMGELKALKESADEHRVNLLDIGTRELPPEHYKFELDGFKVALVTDAKDTRLDKEELKKLLIAEGISLKKIDKLFAKATKTKPKKSYAKITIPGDKEGSDE